MLRALQDNSLVKVKVIAPCERPLLMDTRSVEEEHVEYHYVQSFGRIESFLGLGPNGEC